MFCKMQVKQLYNAELMAFPITREIVGQGC